MIISIQGGVQMDLAEKARYWNVAKQLLAVTGVVQKFVHKAGLTHNFCNEQAATILEADGYPRAACLIQTYLKELNEGVSWADRAWKNSSHFFNPSTGKGFWRWPNALLECHLHFHRAHKEWEADHHSKAMFFLGAAAHLVQDLCVPHHARGDLFNGHQDFESWAEANRNFFTADSDGIYHLGETPGAWVAANALFSDPYYPLVAENSAQKNYLLASRVLLPRAQRTTAGFFHFFLRNKI